MSQIENLVTPLKANEKDESKREIDNKATLSFNIEPFANQHQNPEEQTPKPPWKKR